LSLTAADNESRLQTTIDVSNEGSDGSVAINAKNLLDPLRELPDQPLTFEINDDTLEVNIFYHNGKYNFIGLKSEEYPEPKQLSDNVMMFRINAQDLFNGINRTIFATADDELRPVMNGIFFDSYTRGSDLCGI
jgi:DNA polymerase III, beta subunit (EC 2.7.7.7)